MKKFIILILFLISLVFFVIIKNIIPAKDINNLEYQTDFARIESANILREDNIKKIEDIKSSIKYANDNNIKISIAGKKYSGGGNTFTDTGLIIDMGDFNKIINYKPKDKLITVETGITWGEIQQYVNDDNLSIKVMQSSNIFSVGGSISSNIHGRDPKFGTIIDSVESFRLIDSSGELLNVSRIENSELFYSVIGGFGLFGVITDVTLSLTEDKLYIRRTKLLNDNMLNHNVTNYAEYIKKFVIGNNDLGLHYGRLDISKGDSFLKDFYITEYIKTESTKYIGNVIKNRKTIQNLTFEEIESINNYFYYYKRFLNLNIIFSDIFYLFDLKLEKNILVNRLFFNLSRKYDIFKKVRWDLQKKFLDNENKSELISRNNAMNPPIRFLSYYSETDTDILQEYFIPLEKYTEFVDYLREVLNRNSVNLLSVTTRYIKGQEDVLLNYNKSDMIAIVLYMNVGLDEDSQVSVKNYTRDIVGKAINLNGSYYLVYQSYPSLDQFKKTYPKYVEFENLKNKYDPKLLFSNKFYENYFITK